MPSDMEHVDYRCFSYPGIAPSSRRDIVGRLLARDARIQTNRFLREHGAAIRASSSGLFEVLEQWLSAGSSYAEAFGFPLALRSLREPEVHPVRAAALAALHLHTAGRDGEWRASWPEPARMLVGSRLLPSTCEITVSAQGGKIHVEPSTGGRDLPTIDLGARSMIAFGAEARGAWALATPPDDCEDSESSIAHTLLEGVTLLQTYAPDYAAWVADTVGVMVPIRPPNGNGARQSESMVGLPGIVFASFPLTPVRAAETLIHEGCHQLFHYGLTETLYSNGMDTALYWSPYVKRDRPIDRILIAFHAFANIALFRLRYLPHETPHDQDLTREEIALHHEYLNPMREALERTRGLTADGRALFEPLRDALWSDERFR